MKTVMLGLGVLAAGVLVLAAALVASNRALDDDAASAAATMDHSTMTAATGSPAKGGMRSFAGVTADDGTALAKAHNPFPATLPPRPRR
jgi:hypothetical protein